MTWPAPAWLRRKLSSSTVPWWKCHAAAGTGGDADQRRYAVDLGVFEHGRLRGIRNGPQNQRRMNPMPAHPGEIRANGMVAGEPRRVRMAERFSTGARTRDEARERGVGRRLEGREHGQEEDHRTT